MMEKSAMINPFLQPFDTGQNDQYEQRYIDRLSIDYFYKKVSLN